MSYAGGIYGFDRWQVTGGGQVQISDNGVIITGVGLYGGFQEFIENWGNFKGKTVTLSFLISGGTAIGNGAYVDILTGESEYTNNVTEAGVASLTVSLPQDITKLQCALITSPNSGYDLTVIAAKLELGSKQTLAHQEGEKWVLNEIPNYAEQLARCQRYLLDITPSIEYNESYVGICGENYASFCISTPVSMRTTPVFVGDPSQIQIGVDYAIYPTPTSVRVITYGKNYVNIRCTLPDETAKGGMTCDFRSRSRTTKFLLSAEL